MKGSVLDIFVALALFTIVAITLLAFSYSSDIIVGVYNDSALLSDESKDVITSSITGTFETFNYGFLTIVVATFITISILAYYVNAHPMFFPISLFISVIAIFFSMFLSNAYWSFVNTDAIWIAMANRYWVVTYIMKHLPAITTLYSGFVLWITYRAKTGGASSGGI